MVKRKLIKTSSDEDVDHDGKEKYDSSSDTSHEEKEERRIIM